MPREFWEVLREIMDTKNLSIPDIARTCGIPDSTIRAILSRKSKSAALEIAAKLSRGLSVSLNYLNGETLNPDQPAAKPHNSSVDAGELNGVFFRLKKSLEPFDLTEDDVDFITAVYKAHKERNTPANR